MNVLVGAVVVVVALGIMGARGRKQDERREDSGDTVPPARPPSLGGARTPADPGGLKSGVDLDVLKAAGEVFGRLAGASAMTNTGKALGLPVGVATAGLAAVLQMAGAGAALGVGSALAWLGPVWCITLFVTTVIDLVARVSQVGQWREMALKVKELRSLGRFNEAYEVWRQCAEKITPICQTDPQPGEDWYDASNQGLGLGYPYPLKRGGLRGEPAPMTAEQLKSYPSNVPATVKTADGESLNVGALTAAFEGDVTECREWGLANGVPGRVVGLGSTKGSFTDVVDGVTSGLRDLTQWEPLRARIEIRQWWYQQLESAVPWLSASALDGARSRVPAESVEVAVRNVLLRKADEARAATAAALVTAQNTRTARQVSANAGVSMATALAAVNESRRDSTKNAANRPANTHTSTAVSESEAADEGRGSPTNNSGSGGRNG